MPDNAIYYQVAYLAIAVLYVGYALLLAGRRRALARRARSRGSPGGHAGEGPG